ncbi:MAG: phenylacetate--CoA ligase, partial [Actinomycetota bacterium]
MWNEAVQTMPPEDLAALQLDRLHRLVRVLHERVPFYRERMTALGVAPGDVRELVDLARLPFTSKADMREGYPFGLFAVDP